MAFGLRYYAELRSKHKEVFWRVEIHERGFTGKSEEMASDGSSPLSITWEKRGDEFFIPVKASEATINILCQQNFHYINLFTSDPRKFRVSVYRNTKLYWRGYVVADLYSENFTAPPYQVSIKAVDGFNLLQSVPFFNLDNSQLKGRKSLWELMSMCFDLLELEIDIADWMDLYAEGMNESISPLRQVYVDMERFYIVYNEPTYRDVLELCLRPFAGQIFQSNGALHIRRTISLYNDSRPMSYYSVGKEFPVGWLIAADGRNLETHTDEPIITEATRERIESMWESDINVLGESVMDIVTELSRLSRSLHEIMQIMKFCVENNVEIHSTKDGYIFDDSINSKVLSFAFGLATEIEHKLISQRTREAMALRKAEGKHMGRHKGSGEKMRILRENRSWLLEQLKTDRSIISICRELGVSYDTLYRFRKTDAEVEQLIQRRL